MALLAAVLWLSGRFAEGSEAAAAAVGSAASAAATVASSGLRACAPGAFCSEIVRLDADHTARMTGVSWRPGCPVALADLRVVRATYWDMAGAARSGELVVHRDAAPAMVRVLSRLFAAGFPIASMVPIDVYGGDDDASTRANNSSAFNCRAAYGATKGFSQHAYGRAVDLNPLQNPYVRRDGTTLDPLAQRFVAREAVRGEPGVIDANGPVVAAFAAERWGWGGRWSSPKDYQHFSANGR